MAGRSGEWSYATSNRPSRDDPGRDARLLDARATLRLLFAPGAADRLALLSDRPDPDQSLRRMIDLAHPRYLWQSWRARLPGGKDGEAPPLVPNQGIGGRSALALALQLGLNVTGGQLSDLLRRSGDEIGEDLYQARRALDPTLPMPCPEQIPTLGRYCDPSLNVNERVGLLRHAADCNSCRAALERFQQIDAELLEELSRQREALEHQPLPGISLPSRLGASPVALVLVAILVLVVIVGAAGFGLSRLAGSHHNPVPLIAAAASPAATAQTGAARPTGWLILTTTDNGVEAVNLTTAEQRTIVPGNAGQGGSFQMLSPNQQLLATIGPEQSNGNQPIPVVIRRLDGTVVANHQLDYSSDSIPWLLGWLDNQTLLVGEEPAARLNSPPVPQEVTVDAVSIKSWQPRRFFAGNVIQLSISPDGKLALVTDEPELGWKGATIELRPVLPNGAGLGAPLATIQHRGIVANPIWAPDSSRFYLSRIDDTDIYSSPSATPGDEYKPPQHASIVAVDRQGHISTVVAPNTDAIALPIAISEDGRTIYYEYELSEVPGTSSGNSDQRLQLSLWSTGIDGGNRKQLGAINPQVGPPAILTVPWNPSTRLFIGGQQPYLNGKTPVTVSEGPLAWPVVDAYQSGQTPEPLLSLPNIVPFESLAWLPESALPAQATSSSQSGSDPSSGQPTAPEPVPGVNDDQIADASSSVSSDGRYVLLTNLDDHSPVIIDRSNAALSRELDPDYTNPSWIPGQDIVVTAWRPSSQYTHPQLKLSTPPPQQGDFPEYDDAGFDPANLEQAPPSQVYAAPAVSPDGLTTAFFVLDRSSNNVALWLAQAGHPARAVDHWSGGTKQSGNLALLAAWVNSRTLLYAMPGGWKNNLPQQPELVRLTIHPDGTLDQKVLLTLPKSGFDRGVAVDDLALSRDGEQVALRVRHYAHADHRSGVSDAIIVMPASDLGQRVQIEQAAPGSGLSWSPSGDWLTFGLNGKIEVASANGATLHQVALPAGTTGTSPLWVGANEVWFTQDNGIKRELRRVVVR